MQIVLTVEDLRKLKPATRAALLGELGLDMPSTAKSRVGNPSPAPRGKAEGDALELLVSSINDRAKAALTVLVGAGGSLEWPAIHSKVRGLEMGRFMASVHRRYRTLTRNPKATIVSLKDRGDVAVLSVSKPVAAKLKPLLK